MNTQLPNPTRLHFNNRCEHVGPVADLRQTFADGALDVVVRMAEGLLDTGELSPRDVLVVRAYNFAARTAMRAKTGFVNPTEVEREMVKLTQDALCVDLVLGAEIHVKHLWMQFFYCGLGKSTLDWQMSFLFLRLDDATPAQRDSVQAMKWALEGRVAWRQGKYNVAANHFAQAVACASAEGVSPCLRESMADLRAIAALHLGEYGIAEAALRDAGLALHEAPYATLPREFYWAHGLSPLPL